VKNYVSIPLDNHYGTFSTESLFEEYKKGIPDLTISSELRTKEELKRTKEDTRSANEKVSAELRSIKEDNAEMKERFAGLEDILKELSKRD